MHELRERERERERGGGTRDPANPRNRGAKITAEGLSSQCPALDKDSRRVCENCFPINNAKARLNFKNSKYLSSGRIVKSRGRDKKIKKKEGRKGSKCI